MSRKIVAYTEGFRL